MEPLTKELAQKLMKLEGEARGVVFETDATFILREKGKEGLEKVQEELKQVGCPIEYEKIEPMDFYPVGLRILSLLAIQKVFHFSDEDIKRMGSQAPKKSLIIKLFVKYFLSLSKTGQQAPKMWEKNYTTGELSVEENVQERWAILRLKYFAPHPLLCPYLEGYFTTVVKMIVGDPVFSQETKCPFKGDLYHEFHFTW